MVSRLMLDVVTLTQAMLLAFIMHVTAHHGAIHANGIHAKSKLRLGCQPQQRIASADSAGFA